MDIECDIKSTSCANISHSPNSLSKPVSDLFQIFPFKIRCLKMCQLAKFWCQKYILSQLNIFWLVTPWLRTWHIGAWGAVRGSQGKLITPGSFDLQKMIPSLVRKLLLYSEQYLTICFLFNGRWWIVGRVRFLRINISCLTSSLWRSAQKEALKALEDSWKVLDGPMYAVEGLGRSLETNIPYKHSFQPPIIEPSLALCLVPQKN